MKRPAVTVALVYVGGLLLAEWLRLPLVVLFALSLTVVCCAVLSLAARGWLVWPLVFFTGWTNQLSHTAVLSPYDLRDTQRDATEIVALRGTLAETPSRRLYLKDEREVSRSLAVLQTSQIGRGTNWASCFGRVLILTPGILPDKFFEGQEVEITGVLSLPSGPLAEGLFDYRKYLRRQEVYYQLKVESRQDWSLLSAERAPPLSDRFLTWAQTTLARGLPVEDESLQLLWAMTLGWKTGLTNEIYEPFMRSGTMHIFAISGLHIALIAGILVAVLRVVRVERSWCGILVIPLIWFYTGVTGWQPSAIRSAIMMTVVIGGWSLRRPANLVNSLAASALLILIWDPQQLFGASFQLSFFCVLSIGLLLPGFEEFCDRLLAPDEFLPEQLVPLRRQRLRTPLRWLLLTFATSLAAWLGSLPLTAYYFHLFSPITLLANLLIVPLSSTALCCNVGSLLCGSCFPWISELFNHSAWFWMECMVHLSRWASAVPLSYVYVRSPSLAGMVIYYLLAVGLASGWLLMPRRRRWTLTAVGVLGVLQFSAWQLERYSASLSVLPTNGGLSVFVQAPGIAHDLLIDPGNSNSVETVTTAFLRGQGVNRLPALALSHGDIRHVGGASLLADLFSVREVYVSPVRFRSPVYRRVLGQLAANPNRVKTVYTEGAVEHWTVLHPGPQEHYPAADENCLVLGGTLYGTRILLVSDLGIKGQNALLQRGADLHADIVITGLPNDGRALSDDFLEAIQPQFVIVADSEFPASEHASSRLIERLEEKGIRVLYTRSAGAATIKFHQGGWQVQTTRGMMLDSRQLPEPQPSSQPKD